MRVLNSKLIMVMILLAVFFSPLMCVAEIFMYRDQDGVLHFTNIPMASMDKPFQFIPYKKEIGKNPGSQIDMYINQASIRYNLSCHLIKAVIKVESDFDCRAISAKGAMGLMQIMPDNFQSLLIENPFNPWENIMGGARYLKDLLRRYDGNLSLSLAAYNAGPSAVDRYGKQIPPYPETRNYVQKVLKYLNFYKNEG